MNITHILQKCILEERKGPVWAKGLIQGDSLDSLKDNFQINGGILKNECDQTGPVNGKTLV